MADDPDMVRVLMDVFARDPRYQSGADRARIGRRLVMRVLQRNPELARLRDATIDRLRADVLSGPQGWETTLEIFGGNEQSLCGCLGIDLWPSIYSMRRAAITADSYGLFDAISQMMRRSKDLSLGELSDSAAMHRRSGAELLARDGALRRARVPGIADDVLLRLRTIARCGR